MLDASPDEALCGDAAAVAPAAAPAPAPAAGEEGEEDGEAEEGSTVGLGAGSEGAGEGAGAAAAAGAEPRKRSGPGKFLGKVKAKASEATKDLLGSEPVQAGIGFVKDTSKAVSHQGQQGVRLVKGKTKELAESEQVQKGLGLIKDKTKEFKELEIVKGTAKEFRELGAALASTAELVGHRWSAGAGQVHRTPAEQSPAAAAAAWRGNARRTLGLEAQGEDPWRSAHLQAAEEVSVPARGEFIAAHAVSRGARLRWAFRVKEHSIEFGVRTRAFRDGGSVEEEEVLPMAKYGCADSVRGSWVADETWTVVLVFDNRASVLRPKTIAYAVAVEPAGEVPALASASASSSGGAGCGGAAALAEDFHAPLQTGTTHLSADPLDAGLPGLPTTPCRADVAAEVPARSLGPPRFTGAPPLPRSPADSGSCGAGSPDAAAAAGASSVPDREGAFEDLWGSLLDDEQPPGAAAPAAAAAAPASGGDQKAHLAANVPGMDVEEEGGRPAAGAAAATESLLS